MNIHTIGLAPVVLLAFLSGCTLQESTFPAEVTVNESPADASVGVRSVRPASVLAGYTHRTPVEPTPWRERNAIQPDFPTREVPAGSGDTEPTS